MHQRWAARFLALGIAAVLIVSVTGGITAYVAQSLVVGPAKATTMAAVPQMPNRTAKADRAALLLDSPSYTNFSPSFVALAFSPAAAATANPCNAPGNLNGLLNDAQIVGIEKRLRLTPQQARHWPAVAAALCSLGRRYFQSGRRHQYAAKIDVNSPEVQRLIETAMPL
ncbi:MAG: hypothetical protein QOF91_3164, partial [Alphaproteobacteria bacterium]|nr:hypothetical protein [Alphaproteobacteria bacterium]